jgi:DNA-directed RNA polymerase specialized sigma24 family protein
MSTSAELDKAMPSALAGSSGCAEATTFERELAPLLLPAHRLAVAMLMDPALAEDAVQEAALRAGDLRGTAGPARRWAHGSSASSSTDAG